MMQPLLTCKGIVYPRHYDEIGHTNGGIAGFIALSWSGQLG
jgi:hypothetical protein